MEEKVILECAAKLLADGKAIGWMNGHMEFGPRALGNRSIIASPLIKDMQKNLNLKVKFRESFRPFAPSILKEELSEWFDTDVGSPYMLFVANIKKDKLLEIKNDENKLFGFDKLNVIRSKIPAVTHVDNSARVQTVDRLTNPKYYKLICKFKELTGCPILINTSFNIRGEPIVCTPGDAFRCFMGTELDVLIIENYIMFKNNQDLNLKEKYQNKYDLD